MVVRGLKKAGSSFTAGVNEKANCHVSYFEPLKTGSKWLQIDSENQRSHLESSLVFAMTVRCGVRLGLQSAQHHAPLRHPPLQRPHEGRLVLRRHGAAQQLIARLVREVQRFRIGQVRRRLEAAGHQ